MFHYKNKNSYNCDYNISNILNYFQNACCPREFLFAQAFQKVGQSWLTYIKNITIFSHKPIEISKRTTFFFDHEVHELGFGLYF